MDKTFSFLVLGCGSIGRRHIENLLNDGNVVEAWNRGSTRLHSVKNEFCIKVHHSLELALEKDFDAIFVCTPNSLHFEHASLALAHKKNIFIEKPVTTSIDDAASILRQAEDKNVFVYVSTNMRFHPGPRHLKSLMDSNSLGDIVWAGVWGGMHLPSWHPREDYMKMYSSLIELGGGVINDFIHELDLVNWLLGRPKSVFALKRSSKALQIETEDICDAIFEMETGFTVGVHFDYLQKPYQRGIKIIGTTATAEWNLNTARITIFDKSGKQTFLEKFDKDKSQNEMYINQQKFFIERLTDRIPKLDSLKSGIDALSLAEAIKKSSDTRKLVRVPYVT